MGTNRGHCSLLELELELELEGTAMAMCNPLERHALTSSEMPLSAENKEPESESEPEPEPEPEPEVEPEVIELPVNGKFVPFTGKGYRLG